MSKHQAAGETVSSPWLQELRCCAMDLSGLLDAGIFTKLKVYDIGHGTQQRSNEMLGRRGAQCQG